MLRTPPAARDETGPAARGPHIGHRRALSKRDDEKRRLDIHTKIPLPMPAEWPVSLCLYMHAWPARPSGNPRHPPSHGAFSSREHTVNIGFSCIDSPPDGLPVRRAPASGFMRAGAARDGRVPTYGCKVGKYAAGSGRSLTVTAFRVSGWALPMTIATVGDATLSRGLPRLVHAGARLPCIVRRRTERTGCPPLSLIETNLSY